MVRPGILSIMVALTLVLVADVVRADEPTQAQITIKNDAYSLYTDVSSELDFAITNVALYEAELAAAIEQRTDCEGAQATPLQLLPGNLHLLNAAAMDIIATADAIPAKAKKLLQASNIFSLESLTGRTSNTPMPLLNTMLQSRI